MFIPKQEEDPIPLLGKQIQYWRESILNTVHPVSSLQYFIVCTRCHMFTSKQEENSSQMPNRNSMCQAAMLMFPGCYVSFASCALCVLPSVIHTRLLCLLPSVLSVLLGLHCVPFIACKPHLPRLLHRVSHVSCLLLPHVPHFFPVLHSFLSTYPRVPCVLPDVCFLCRPASCAPANPSVLPCPA